MTFRDLAAALATDQALKVTSLSGGTLIFSDTRVSFEMNKWQVKVGLKLVLYLKQTIWVQLYAHYTVSLIFIPPGAVSSKA